MSQDAKATPIETKAMIVRIYTRCGQKRRENFNGLYIEEHHNYKIIEASNFRFSITQATITIETKNINSCRNLLGV